MADPDGPPPDLTSIVEELNRQLAEARANVGRITEALQRLQAINVAQKQQLRRATDRATVLVVDDEHAVLAVVGRSLFEAGYQVILARSGLEALEAMEKLKGQLDLLLTDLRMPQMSGVQLAAEVRRIQPDAGVLLMAGYPSEDTLQWPVLVKPFAAGELELEVGRVLDVRRRSGPTPRP